MLKQYSGQLIPLICIVILSVSFIPVQADTGSYADIVLLNGSVYTVDQNTDWSEHPLEAIAIKGQYHTIGKFYAGYSEIYRTKDHRA